MPKKEKTYLRTKFPPSIIKKAHETLLSYVSEESKPSLQKASILETKIDLETWSFDKDEEFYSEYRKKIDQAQISYSIYVGSFYTIFSCSFEGWSSTVSVGLEERFQVEAVFEIFEDALEDSRLPDPTFSAPPPKPQVFIGHGHSSLWRELKDYLESLQGFQIAAYESDPRAGYSIKEVLQRLLAQASFAILIHTAEDEQLEGDLRARENVVHETGLFQGRIGFERAIVLREDGCHPFSNNSGINEIRFSKGNIRATFGEVVTTLYREFPNKS